MVMRETEPRRTLDGRTTFKRVPGGIVRMGTNNRNKRRQRPKRFEGFCQAVQWYCTDTTLHGLKYVMDTELTCLERLFWLAIVALSSILAVKTIYMIAEEFQAYPTVTSIDSTSFRTSGIPFPSVVICPGEHVDWKRAMDLEKRIFPNSTTETSIETFREILKRLSNITFGDFDLLDFLNERDLRDIADKQSGLDINVTRVLLETMPQCRDLFTGCWWRNSYRNCCEIFELQKTEYGFCYAFNSEMSEVRWAPTNDRESRPRRASGYGEWSGVQVTTHLGNISKPPEAEEANAVYVLIQGPGVWPNSGTMTPVGIALSIALDCISGYATQRVLELDVDRMPCKYDESGHYNQQSCISFCKRAHAVKYCGCNPSFLFPTNPERDCNIEDLLCLARYNDAFNSYYVLQDESIVDDKPAMLCDCPPECEYYFYKPKITSVPISGREDIAMDVHFQTQTSFRYKTDIVFTKLGLLVSFGGIIGLFLGASLLSAAELVYYLLALLYYYVSSWYKPGKRKVNVRGANAAATVTVIPRLPILDYGPLKSRSRKIPNLLVYDYAKQKPDRY